MPDIIVIGAGLIGMLSARELAMAGARVLVLEKQASGRESSWAGGGILSPIYPWRYPEAVNQLARWSQGVYPGLLEQLKQETGVDPEYQPCGLLMLDEDQQDEALAWAKHYPTQLLQLDAQALAEQEPSLATSWQSASLFPELGQVRNPRLINAMRTQLIKLGVTIREQTPVEELLIAAGRVQGVRTVQERLTADKVVVAGGAWTAQLLSGLDQVPPVRPVRGQMLLYKTTQGAIRHVVLYQGRYLIPRRDGHLLIGSTLEDVGFDKQTTEQALHELRQQALELFPFLAHLSVVKQWAGLRPGSPEGIPCIAEHPEIQGLFVNAGHYRNGVVTGPASARLLADLVMARQPSLDPAPYRLFSHLR